MKNSGQLKEWVEEFDKLDPEDEYLANQRAQILEELERYTRGFR